MQVSDSAPPVNPPVKPYYVCRFPGCQKRYATVDAVRKHANKFHPEWMEDVNIIQLGMSYGTRTTVYAARAGDSLDHDIGISDCDVYELRVEELENELIAAQEEIQRLKMPHPAVQPLVTPHPQHTCFF